jgi:phosphoenolpyruvate-protein kinase (PTS system EI component)
MRIVCEEAGEVPVTVCGELAADLDSISILLKLGLRSFSVAPPLVPGVKGAIRQTSSV